MSNCPCGSGRALNECCEPLLKGLSQAQSPEQLMRSRYSAYCLKDFDYLVGTTDPQRRVDFDVEGTREWMEGSVFTGLEVIRASMDGNKGVVEFRARFRGGNGEKDEEVHHEVAKFRKQAGIWYFRPR